MKLGGQRHDTQSTMIAAAEPHDLTRGAGLILQHCAALSRFEPLRPPARERLERAVGDDLTRRLLVALTGDHRMPSRGLPG